jgi:hypothetical protein
MSLQEKLDAYRSTGPKRIPQESLTVMHRATEDLRHSGILERTLKPGQMLPEFALPNVEGAIVRSRQLLEKGPLVLSFYRGVW